MTPDTKHLRTIANAATPGPWAVVDRQHIMDEHGEPTDNFVKMGCDTYDDSSVLSCENAQHIATFDPPTIIALLDRLEGLEMWIETFGDAKKAAP